METLLAGAGAAPKAGPNGSKNRRVDLPGRPVARDRAHHPALVADIAIRYDDASLVSLAFTSAGDDLRGVRERIYLGRGGTTIFIEDFDHLEIVRGAKTVRKRFGRNRGHAAEIRDVVRKLRSGVRDQAMISDMVVTSAIMFAALRSFDTGREESVEILDAWRRFAT